ncbi:MAG: polyprenyl synthetase family protein [Acetanaerobacterium sp.]
MSITMTMDVNRRAETYAAMVNAALSDYLDDTGLPQQEVVDAMRYSLLCGGKRVRAILLLEFSRMCGGRVQDALPFACAVEMLHCYSLIHDDLPCMDDDDLRRGRPSCHIQFGEATALLAGDALLTLAFEVMLENAASSDVSARNTLRAAGVLARASGYHGMVGGQVIDLVNENTQPDAETLTLIHEMKTSALIRAAAAMGCIVADADEALIAAADGYAKKIGLSFQIVDDILDIIGTSEELGKPAGSDNKNRKNTFATLYGVEKAKIIAGDLGREALQFLSAFPHEDEFIHLFTGLLTQRKK